MNQPLQANLQGNWAKSMLGRPGNHLARPSMSHDRERVRRRKVPVSSAQLWALPAGALRNHNLLLGASRICPSSLRWP